MIYAFLTMTAAAAIALPPQDNQSVPQTVTPQPSAPVPTQVQPPVSTAPATQTPPASAPVVVPPVVRPTLPAANDTAPAEEPAARPTRSTPTPARERPQTQTAEPTIEAETSTAPEAAPAEAVPEQPLDQPAENAAAPAVPAENTVAPEEAAPTEQGGFPWLWLVLGVVIAAIGVFLFRRAAQGREEGFVEPEPAYAEPVAVEEPLVEAAPTATVAPEAVAPEGFADAHALDAEPAQVDALGIIAAQGTDPDAPRALIDIAFRPTGAGTEVLEAVVDFEMDIMNNGTADAHGVQVSVWMSSASPYQDEEIAHFHANIPAEARMPEIEVPAGASRPVSGRIGIARQGIHVVTVRERPLFVPIVMLDVRWAWDSGEGHMQRAFVIGTGAAGEKLGPIWLDRGPRIHTDVGARVHSESISA